MSRYKKTFKFFDTEEAIDFCATENSNYYVRRYHPAHYTPWTSKDGTENKFIAWYVTK